MRISANQIAAYADHGVISHLYQMVMCVSDWLIMDLLSLVLCIAICTI